MSEQAVHGVMARYKDPGALIQAAEKVRDAGYKKFDCHSPFPIHGMDDAMGLKRSPMGWIVGTAATIGGIAGLALQWWTSTIDYPIVISGKPLFSFQAYIFVTFALAVLCSAFAASIGMLMVNKLPRYHHPVFYSDLFKRCSNDSFFISVLSDDPKFDKAETGQFLQSIGGNDVEVLEG